MDYDSKSNFYADGTPVTHLNQAETDRVKDGLKTKIANKQNKPEG